MHGPESRMGSSRHERRRREERGKVWKVGVRLVGKLSNGRSCSISHHWNLSRLSREDIIHEPHDLKFFWQVRVIFDDFHVRPYALLRTARTIIVSGGLILTADEWNRKDTYELQLAKSIFSTSAALSPSKPALSFNKDPILSLLKFLSPQSLW